MRNHLCSDVCVRLVHGTFRVINTTRPRPPIQSIMASVHNNTYEREGGNLYMSGDAWIGKCQNDVQKASECFTLLSRLSEFILALSKVSLRYCITHTN